MALTHDQLLRELSRTNRDRQNNAAQSTGGVSNVTDRYSQLMQDLDRADKRTSGAVNTNAAETTKTHLEENQ